MSKKRQNKGAAAPEQVIEVKLGKICPFKDQPRQYFNPKYLQELANSIATAGQQVPLIVRQIPIDQEGRQYELIDGECRWRAMIQANPQMMAKVIVRDIKDPDRQFINSLLANEPRSEHTVLERIHAIERLRKMGKTVEQIAQLLGVTPPSVYQHLGILKLAPGVTALMDPHLPKEEQLKFSIAIMLRSVEEPKTQLDLAKKIVASGMSHERAKHLIHKVLFAKGSKRPDRHSPHKQFKIFSDLIERTNNSFELWEDNPAISKVFRSRSWDERRDMVAHLKQVVERVNHLTEMIREAGKSAQA